MSGPLDGMVDDWVKAARAQAKIQEFIKEAAKNMAAAARLSSLITGDRAESAASKWTAVMTEETKRILREQAKADADASPKAQSLLSMEKLLEGPKKDAQG